MEQNTYLTSGSGDVRVCACKHLINPFNSHARAGFLAALSLQAVLPVTILFSIVVPLYFAWGRWIEWKLCPVAVATYVSLFLKFPPWVLWSGEFFWVWPGFI